jgi:4-carboxymuconolactone decarboxylase
MTMVDIEQRLRSLASGNDRQKHLDGLDVLRHIGGQNFGGPINSLADFSEDLARFTVQFAYGDVLSRAGLDLRCRQILTVSMLLAHGSAQAQLAFHLNGLLNVGGTADDVVDLLYLAAGLLGFPAAVNAVPIVREVFADRGIAGRGEKSLVPPRVPDGSPDRFEALAAFAPEFLNWRQRALEGEMFAAIRMEPKDAHLAASAMLGAGGKSSENFDQHLAAAVAAGAGRLDVTEMIIQLSVYCGFPAALNAASRAKTLFESKMKTAPARQQSDRASPSSDTTRFKRGADVLAATSGGSGAGVVDSFKDVDSDLGNLIVAHCYGDIFCRDGLEPKVRELTACAALAAQGTVAAEKPLAVHIDAALNLGATREEIVETLFNVIPYAGYPLVEKALLIAAERLSVFDTKQTER